MPQSVGATFDFFHAVLREKENHFQLGWEEKRKMSGGISGHLARLFVCWNERSLSRVWRSEHTHAQMRLMDGLFYHFFFRFVFIFFFPHRVQATPAAHVRWLKDDLPLNLDPARMIVLPSGALELEQVQLSDQVIN